MTAKLPSNVTLDAEIRAREWSAEVDLFRIRLDRIETEAELDRAVTRDAQAAPELTSPASSDAPGSGPGSMRSRFASALGFLASARGGASRVNRGQSAPKVPTPEKIPFRPGLWLSFHEDGECIGRIVVVGGGNPDLRELLAHVESGSELSLSDARRLLPDIAELRWHSDREGRGRIFYGGEAADASNRYVIAVRLFPHWSEANGNRIRRLLWDPDADR